MHGSRAAPLEGHIDMAFGIKIMTFWLIFNLMDCYNHFNFFLLFNPIEDMKQFIVIYKIRPWKIRNVQVSILLAYLLPQHVPPGNPPDLPQQGDGWLVQLTCDVIYNLRRKIMKQHQGLPPPDNPLGLPS